MAVLARNFIRAPYVWRCVTNGVGRERKVHANESGTYLKLKLLEDGNFFMSCSIFQVL